MVQSQIVYFIEVCRQGSITKAAKVLRVTPQAVAKAVKQLEGELGGRLLTRLAAGSQPTELGQGVLKIGGRMVRFNEQAMEEMKDLSHRAGLRQAVGLGLPYSFLQAVPSDIITDFTQLHPEITVNAFSYNSAAEYLHDMETGRIELGFCFFPAILEQMETLHIFEAHLYVIVGRHHRLAGRESVRLEELRGENLIMDTGTDWPEAALADQIKALGLTPRITLPPFSAHTKRTMVQQGNYVAFDAGVKAWLPYGISAVELEGEQQCWTNSFSKLKGRPLSPTAQMYCDYIIPRFEEDIGPSGQPKGKAPG